MDKIKFTHKNRLLTVPKHLYSGVDEDGSSNFLKKALDKAGGTIGVASAAAGAVGGLVGNAISGGLSSGAGNAISGVGNALGAIPVFGGFAKGTLNIVGGGVNALFGMKTNQAELNRVNKGISALNDSATAAAGATSFDDESLMGPDAINFNVNAYKGGLFSKGKARRKNAALQAELKDAYSYTGRTSDNTIGNIADTQLDNALATSAAFGGLLNQYADGGSIHINPENRGKFNATKKRTGKTTEELTHSKNPLTRKRAIFAQNAAKWHHAFGGELNTNGGNFSTGLMFIDEGGTHESNPYEGVPMGIAPDGKPNLVEEGEVIYNDYVFSNRLTVPKDVRNKYKLRGTNDLTFADAVKQLTKGATERPNDPISQETLNDIMTDLMTIQEELRIQQENNKFACGGKKSHLHANGDWLIGDGFFNNRDFTPSNLDANIPYSRSWNNNIGEGVSPKDFEDFTNYALTLDNNNPYWIGLSKATGKDINYLKSNYRALRSDGKYGYVSLTPKRVTQPSQANEWYTTVGRPGGDISFNPEYAGLFGYSIPKNVIGKSTLDNGDTINYVNNYPDTPTTQKPVTPITDKTDDTPLDLGTSDESLRYAPAIGLGLASITDAMGLTNKPDYGEASMIEAAIKGSSYMPVSWNPIGNKLTYKPLDRDYATNKLRAEAGATRKTLTNLSGGNRGSTMAGILAADYNAQGKLGDLFRQAEEYNLAQRQQVENFNRATNQANSQGKLQADMANKQAYANARDYALRGTMAAAEMRQKARIAAEAARSANLSGFLSALGDIGYENKGMNMIRRLAETGYVPLSEPMKNIYATPSARRKLTSNKKKK